MLRFPRTDIVASLPWYFAYGADLEDGLKLQVFHDPILQLMVVLMTFLAYKHQSFHYTSSWVAI